MDAFYFFESEWHLEFDVGCCVGVVCQFVVVVESVVFCSESEVLVPCHACFFPFCEPVEFGSWLDEELHFHLFEFSHAEDELSCYDFVAECFSYLCDSEWYFHAAGLLYVEVVDEYALMVVVCVSWMGVVYKVELLLGVVPSNV